VVAINRAFETCDPAALSCTLTNTWPTATLAWTPPTGANTFTLIDQANRKHVFGLDGQGRISSYQPPEATTPVYTYALCTLNSDHSMANCFGTTQWTNNPNDSFQQFTVPLLWDLVQTSTRKGQNWQYAFSVQPGTWPNGWSVWQRSVLTPLGTQLLTSGNSTPGTENSYGPTDNVTHYDGTVDHFERNVQNFFLSRQTPRGVLTTYTFTKGASPSITKTPVSGSPIYPQTVTYPTCTNSFVCYKPITVQDANGNTGTLTYDPVHGGVLTATGPTVNTPQANGVQPQTRHTYVQRNAWYLSSSGLMTRDTNPIWVLATESYCRMGGAISPPGPPGAGCTLGNDEVVTTYEYGPDSGPNNLLLRGKSVAADGQTLRSCYGHDKQGNKIWETTPNAQPSSCPSY